MTSVCQPGGSAAAFSGGFPYSGCGCALGGGAPSGAGAAAAGGTGAGLSSADSSPLAGWSARKIGRDLGIEVATVHAVQRAIKEKLDVKRDEGPLDTRREMTDKLRAALNDMPPR